MIGEEPRPDIQVPDRGMMATLPQPPAPITRPTFLSAFIQNLGPALSGGAGAESFGGGLSGGLRGIEEQKRYRQQEDISRTMREQQMGIQRTQEQRAATGEGREAELFPLQKRQAALGVQKSEEALKLFTMPGKFDAFMQNAVSHLGELSGDEKALFASAAQESRASLDTTPINRAVERITNQRTISGRTRSGVYVPDDKSQTGWSRVNLDGNGKEVSRIPSAPPASYLPKTTTSEYVVVDDQGNISVVPKISTVTPTFPGQAKATLPTPPAREGTPVQGIKGRVTADELRFQVGAAEIRRTTSEMETNVKAYRAATAVAGKLEALGKLNTQLASLAQVVRQRGEVGTLNEGDIQRARNAIVTARSLLFEDLPLGLGAIQKRINDDRLRQLEAAIATAEAARNKARGRGTGATDSERRVIDFTQ